MSHIYIYNIYKYISKHKHIHTWTHTHTHSRADLTVYFVIVHESPWAWNPLQQLLPPASVHTHTHTRITHLIFLAIAQPSHLSKPYHRSLHSCSLSISISHTQTQASGFSVCCLLSASRSSAEENWGESHTQSLISPNPLLIPVCSIENISESTPFVSDAEDHYCCVSPPTSARFHDVSTGQDRLILPRSFEEKAHAEAVGHSEERGRMIWILPLF